MKEKRELSLEKNPTGSIGPGYYYSKKDQSIPKYKKMLKGSAFSSKTKKGMYGELLVGKAEKKKLLDNLNYLVSLEPGPGAYFSEDTFSSFNRESNKESVFQPFEKGSKRFNTKIEINPVGPGQYKVEKPFIKQTYNVSTNNAPFLRKSSFLEKKQPSKLDEIRNNMLIQEIQKRHRIAQRKKQKQLEFRKKQLKSRTDRDDKIIAKIQQIKSEEKNHSIGPGEYSIGLSLLGKGGGESAFKSTTKRQGIESQLGNLETPSMGYYLVQNGTIADNIEKRISNPNHDKQAPFAINEARFTYQKKVPERKRLIEMERKITENEKLVKVLKQLYKGDVEYKCDEYQEEINNRPSYPFNQKEERIAKKLKDINPETGPGRYNVGENTRWIKQTFNARYRKEGMFQNNK